MKSTEPSQREVPFSPEAIREQLERPFRDRSLIFRLFVVPSLLLAAIYAGVMWLRRYWWQSFPPRFDDSVVASDTFLGVIAVGNVTAGGAGKSPFVRLLAEHSLQQGRRVLVVSRGYGSREGVWCGHAADANALSESRREGKLSLPSLSAKHLSDEFYELLALLPPGRITLAQAAHRRLAIEEIWRAWQGEADAPQTVVLLDDAFQHLRCPRDVNICLWPEALLAAGRKPPAPPYCFPAGIFREGWGRSLFRLAEAADFNIRTGGTVTEESRNEPRSCASLEGLTWPLGQAPAGWEHRLCYRLRMVQVLPQAEGEHTPGFRAVEAWPNVNQAIVITGIARPERFLEGLESTFPSLSGGLTVRVLADHAPFATLSQSDWPQERGPVILTGKDWSRFCREGVFLSFLGQKHLYICLADPLVESLNGQGLGELMAQIDSQLATSRK